MSRLPCEAGQRLRLMLLGWGSVGLVYFGTGYLPREAHALSAGWLDRLIDFQLHSVWLYVSFFALVPWAYASAPLGQARTLARAMPLCAGVCALCFLAWPTTLSAEAQGPAAEAIGQAGPSAWLYAVLLAGDTPRNCLPSLHGALTVLSARALCERRRPGRSLCVLALSAAICWSVLALRRHVVLDLVAGLLLGALAGWWASRRSVCRDSR